MTQANPHGSILLADDHGLVRHGLQLLIAEVLPQLRVHLTGSLAETVQVLSTAGRFDLVLLDLTLSDVHGMAGLRRLREEFPYVPVVILSAQGRRCHAHATTRGAAHVRPVCDKYQVVRRDLDLPFDAILSHTQAIGDYATFVG